ncbi:hypothetical protein GOODEAATRI_021091 [Goodea atripinnis]|uniref:Uncharacterized protein n=1 Tax=Goodea atripinnis TaxID=208336 RepID=A0ABV0NM27_9TELE
MPNLEGSRFLLNYLLRSAGGIYEGHQRKACLSPLTPKLHSPRIVRSECDSPLNERSWLGSQGPSDRVPETPKAIGDGKYFPCLEIARETEWKQSQDKMLS